MSWCFSSQNVPYLIEGTLCSGSFLQLVCQFETSTLELFTDWSHALCFLSSHKFCTLSTNVGASIILRVFSALCSETVFFVRAFLSTSSSCNIPQFLVVSQRAAAASVSSSAHSVLCPALVSLHTPNLWCYALNRVESWLSGS